MSPIEARSGEGHRGERHLRVVVAGVGFSGLSIASRLRERGEEDFVVLERGESLGGAWRDNTYPEVACDVPSHLYSLSFAPNPDWGSNRRKEALKKVHKDPPKNRPLSQIPAAPATAKICFYGYPDAHLAHAVGSVGNR